MKPTTAFCWPSSWRAGWMRRARSEPPGAWPQPPPPHWPQAEAQQAWPLRMPFEHQPSAEGGEEVPGGEGVGVVAGPALRAGGGEANEGVEGAEGLDGGGVADAGVGGGGELVRDRDREPADPGVALGFAQEA